MQQEKNSKGQFTKKGETDRKVRSIRLTDETWKILGQKADEYSLNRADFLEALASGKIGWK